MNRLLPILVLMAPALAAANAADSRSVSQPAANPKIQQMLEKIQAMQNCMKDVDKAELQALESQAKQLSSDVKQLCAAGKRDEAQQRAIGFGQEISANKAMQLTKKCSEGLAGLTPDLVAAESYSESGKARHICDNSIHP
ncbi:hypothetical protein PL263_04945 [Methylomonas sp. EFPC3]|uniref:hypothetical protein n=1 Tax=Methylomonas sp. EFPC3 TaxID=3021710 RepID=UPI0024180DC8|nr:hypothetical protein [Methylomonas sp. EFPC3]WFP51376.1 hypothetical protein PL263_04945 [Methylomonas sp. EFPC3]